MVTGETTVGVRCAHLLMGKIYYFFGSCFVSPGNQSLGVQDGLSYHVPKEVCKSPVLVRFRLVNFKSKQTSEILPIVY